MRQKPKSKKIILQFTFAFFLISNITVAQGQLRVVETAEDTATLIAFAGIFSALFFSIVFYLNQKRNWKVAAIIMATIMTFIGAKIYDFASDRADSEFILLGAFTIISNITILIFTSYTSYKTRIKIEEEKSESK
ncbi:hypothetical protein [Adhaeribacter soli]|uniref:Uncharacterized protein n=1 Tax=Adhaeribacter soli TaxID=2607655 RepID=A0A5N1J7Q6_9BACT|nr:hypothetical protein [Adhaeribacter soli]KAA9346002.1 hypothetical protein F0P94_02675 [Adhaeribacter soli]